MKETGSSSRSTSSTPGRAVAKLVRVAAKPRQSGRLKGRIHVGPEYEEPLPDEIQAAFDRDRE
jgi:hypothetical protein